MVAAARRAVTVVTAKGNVFLGAWQRRNPSLSVLFNVFENVLVFETGAELAPTLPRLGFEFEWEPQYAPTWRAGHADLALVPREKAHNKPKELWANRLVVEVKWLRPDGKMTGLASDALKLAWASGSKRYLLAAGVLVETPQRLGERVFDAAKSMVKSKARRNLKGIRVAHHETGDDGLSVVLFEVQHQTTLID